MSGSFFTTLRNVTVAHFFIVVAIVFSSTWHGCQLRNKPLIMPVEFMIEVPGIPDASKVTTNTKIQKDSERIISSDKVMIKQTTQKQSPSKTVSKGVKKQPQRVLTEEEIKKFLSEGAVVGDKTIIPDELSRNMELIRRTLYAAWAEPSAAETGNLWVDVELEFDGVGRIIGWSIIQKSGLKVMDDSVTTALKSVSFINGLSPSFLERYRRVTVRFEVK